MDKKFEGLNLHQKLEIIIQEMVDRDLSLKDSIREFEKIYVETTARKYKGNKTKTAKALGIHRNTLHNRSKTLKTKRKRNN